MNYKPDVAPIKEPKIKKLKQKINHLIYLTS